MNKIVLTTIIFFAYVGYDKLLELFPEAEYNVYGNYLTRSLNWNNYSDLEKYTIVPDHLSFVYLCDEDSSKFFYEYDLYHMEDGYLIKHVKESYDHYAVASFRKHNYDMFIYSKYGPDSEQYYLRSFDKNGRKIDELMINEIVYAGTSIVAEKFRSSVIENDTIKTFSYKDSLMHNKENNLDQVIANVLIDSYSIDTLGRFHLASTDSVVLSKSIQNYRNFNVQPNADDPIAKYWTQ